MFYIDGAEYSISKVTYKYEKGAEILMFRSILRYTVAHIVTLQIYFNQIILNNLPPLSIILPICL